MGHLEFRIQDFQFGFDDFHGRRCCKHQLFIIQHDIEHIVGTLQEHLHQPRILQLIHDLRVFKYFQGRISFRSFHRLLPFHCLQIASRKPGRRKAIKFE